MKFLEIAKILNKQYQGKIVLIKNGIFLVAVGRSAIAFSELFQLKRICISYGICKTGVPIIKIEEYIKELCEMSVPFVIYEYIAKPTFNMSQYNKIMETEGINKHNIINDSIDCKNCISLCNFKKTLKLDNEVILDKLKQTLDKSEFETQQIRFFGKDYE